MRIGRQRNTMNDAASKGVNLKKLTEVDRIALIHEIELDVSQGISVTNAYRKVGISDAAYYAWKRKLKAPPEKSDTEKAL